MASLPCSSADAGGDPWLGASTLGGAMVGEELGPGGAALGLPGEAGAFLARGSALVHRLVDRADCPQLEPYPIRGGDPEQPGDRVGLEPERLPQHPVNDLGTFVGGQPRCPSIRHALHALRLISRAGKVMQQQCKIISTGVIVRQRGAVAISKQAVQVRQPQRDE